MTRPVTLLIDSSLLLTTGATACHIHTVWFPRLRDEAFAAVTAFETLCHSNRSGAVSSRPATLGHEPVEVLHLIGTDQHDLTNFRMIA